MKVNLGNFSVGKNLALVTYLLAATGAIANADAVKALDVNLIPGAGIDSDIYTGFEAAAAILESQIADPITVNLNVNSASLNPGVLGQAQSFRVVSSYANIENALITDASSSDDTTATANLPGISNSAFAFVGTEDDGSLEILDGYDSGTSTLTASNDNQFLAVNRANAKALGLLDANNTASDASITFSTNFSFDFDRSDGITGGQYDFIGVALHEIGHSLGFTSGVDIVDLNAAGKLDSDSDTDGVQRYDLDELANFSVLDLYRHSDLSQAVGADAGIPVLDLSVEGKDTGGNNEVVPYAGTDYDAEPYLSIDGGISALLTDGEEGLFSTGRNFGDGQQASHWKDSLGIGLLDPTFASGVQGDLTNSDLRAFDVIGYDITSASVPFEFSPGLGIFLVGSIFTFKKLSKRQSNVK